MTPQGEVTLRATRSTAGRPRRRVVAGMAALVLSGSIAVAGCSSPLSSDAPTASTARASLAANPQNGSALAVDQFAAATERSGVVIIDVRTAQEFVQGHLAGAVNIDVSSPDFAGRVKELDSTRPYAVYCHSGNRSAVAVGAMTSAGFVDVVHLAGGITAWTESGLPLERS